MHAITNVPVINETFFFERPCHEYRTIKRKIENIDIKNCPDSFSIISLFRFNNRDRNNKKIHFLQCTPLLFRQRSASKTRKMSILKIINEKGFRACSLLRLKYYDILYIINFLIHYSVLHFV